ncbi:methyltransferase domain-containing protein [Nocardia sp. NPDC051832]|uniref:methyltransferase domain-containing protein n=1 Tax=Nocardia sp. NPDC051832 TaxID=3155673 RepID=UPI0034398F51
MAGTTHSELGSAADRVRAMFDPERVPAVIGTARGYFDLLAEDAPEPGLGQSVMEGWFYPRIYRYWRPLVGRVAAGPRNLLDPRSESARLMARLAPQVGDAVLDIGCGPGNFTDSIAREVGPDGLAVGLDISATMLAQAVRAGTPANTVYVRGDAHALPFPDAAFDAVSCFTALFLMPEPFRAIDEMVRVLEPGGSIAVLTSCASRWPLLRPAERLAERVADVTVFGRTEIVDAFEERGVAGLTQEFAGVAQIVAGRLPLS